MTRTHNPVTAGLLRVIAAQDHAVTHMVCLIRRLGYEDEIAGDLHDLANAAQALNAATELATGEPVGAGA